MPDQSPKRRTRDVSCEKCGAVFTCDLTGTCWCASVPFRLPLPDTHDDEGFKDCLCPRCLEAVATGQ